MTLVPKLLMLACAATFAVACGDVPADVVGAVEEMSVSPQELTTCTATCAQGTVSCPSGTSSCTANNYQGATCDGVLYACPTPPAPTCSDTDCSRVVGMRCPGEGEFTNCCDGDGYIRACECPKTRRWICHLPSLSK